MFVVNEYWVDMCERWMEVVLVLLLNVFFFLFERFKIMVENIDDSLNVLINYLVFVMFWKYDNLKKNIELIIIFFVLFL